MKQQEEKLMRIRSYLSGHDYTGMILARQDNFNWITGGGDSRVIIPEEKGAAAIVVTETAVYLISQVMDGRRIMDEEMDGLQAEYIPLHWYEESILEKAASLAGDRPVSDTSEAGIPQMEKQLADIYELHFPLLEDEVRGLKELGAASDTILRRVAEEIRPGMTDRDAEAMLLYEYAKQGIQCDVLLVGTDERIFKYRHPAPVGRTLGTYLLLHSAVRKRGLHCNVSRTLYFGNRLPGYIEKAYRAVCQVEAYCMSCSAEGVRWTEILEGQKKLLKELGFEDHWKGHYPGGRTGYFVCQPDLSLNPDKRLRNNEAYDWFITVEGAKAEELAVNHNGVLKVFSHNGLWPEKKIRHGNFEIGVPWIMMR